MAEQRSPTVLTNGQGQGSHDAHDHDHETHGSLNSYVIGFLLSIVLTIVPLVVVLNHWLEHTGAMVVMLGSAVLQFVVQLLFFMHLREEKKPRWNLMALILGAIVLLTIVIGSIWIMTYNQVAG